MVVRPTQCPFCRSHSATVDHIFIYCSRIRYFWSFFAAELHGVPLTSLSLRQHLLSWWYRSNSTSISGVLKIVIPAIVLSNIWRQYAQLTYGDTTIFSTAALRNSIHFDIHVWTMKIQGSKLAAGPLPSLSWLPRIRTPRLRVIIWQTPPSGRLKLNVDAAVGQQYAAGGAILRDQDGCCIQALSFRLPHGTPLQAEIQATLFGLMYFLPIYRSLIVESDCAQMIACLCKPRQPTGNYHLRQLHDLVSEHQLVLIHTYRETNMPAHYLAQHAMMHPTTGLYNRHTLPSLVKASVALDLTSAALRTV